MRSWLTLLTLACFLPQQFSCCAEECHPCMDVGSKADSDCGHDHGPQPSPSEHEHDQPHLCVATHLFYLSRNATDANGVNLSVWQYAVPSVETAAEELRRDLYANAAAFAPDDPLAAPQWRALLGVWTI